jgi:Mycothiol maleylpyruvate isomerase N-terminal domain
VDGAADGAAVGGALRCLHGPDHGPGGRAQVGPAGGGRASFYISVSDRSKLSPVIHQYIVDHADGHTPATIREQVAATFAQALEAIKTTPPDTIGPRFFGPMRLDEFVATRLVETRVHGMDVTDALGAPYCPCRGRPRWRPRCWMRSWPGGPSRGGQRTWRQMIWPSFGRPLGGVSTLITASRSWG